MLAVLKDHWFIFGSLFVVAISVSWLAWQFWIAPVDEDYDAYF